MDDGIQAYKPQLKEVCSWPKWLKKERKKKKKQKKNAVFLNNLFP